MYFLKHQYSVVNWTDVYLWTLLYTLYFSHFQPILASFIVLNLIFWIEKSKKTFLSFKTYFTQAFGKFAYSLLPKTLFKC